MMADATQDTRLYTKKLYTVSSLAVIAEQMSLVQLFSLRICFLAKVAYKRNPLATRSTRQPIKGLLKSVRDKAATSTKLNAGLMNWSPTIERQIHVPSVTTNIAKQEAKKAVPRILLQTHLIWNQALVLLLVFHSSCLPNITSPFLETTYCLVNYVCTFDLFDN